MDEMQAENRKKTKFFVDSDIKSENCHLVYRRQENTGDNRNYQYFDQ